MKAQKSIIEGKVLFVEDDEFVENLIDFDGGISQIWIDEEIEKLNLANGY